MNTTQSTYRHHLRLPVHLLLALLIGCGAMIPQALAHLGCDHACCTNPAGSGMPHDAMQLEGSALPPCCSPQSSDACRLCQLDKLPLPDLARQVRKGQDHPNTLNVPAAKESRTEDGGFHPDDRPAASAVNRHPPPLYIQNLSLLI